MYIVYSKVLYTIIYIIIVVGTEAQLPFAINIIHLLVLKYIYECYHIIK